jgi:hypothetical protein
MDKAQLKIWIDKGVLRDFKRIVLENHNLYRHGDYSKYGEIALKEFNFKHRKQQQLARNTQSPKTKEFFNTLELWEQIVKAYQDFESYGTLERGMRLKEIPLKETIAKIRNVRYDKTEHRSVDDWVNRLIEHEFIRIHGPHLYQVLFNGTNWFEQESKETDVESPINKQQQEGPELAKQKQKEKEFDDLLKGYDKQ